MQMHIPMLTFVFLLCRIDIEDPHEKRRLFERWFSGPHLDNKKNGLYIVLDKLNDNNNIRGHSLVGESHA
jgi:hypothetical protein